jgi:spermidine synthase
MDPQSSLISIDNDPLFPDIARDTLASDPRVSFVLTDGGDWLDAHAHELAGRTCGEG